jgi:hypothetical protein
LHSRLPSNNIVEAIEAHTRSCMDHTANQASNQVSN